MSSSSIIKNVLGRRMINKHMMTHFIGIRITNPILLDIANNIKQDVLEYHKMKYRLDISKSAISTNLLHISMNIMDFNDTNKLNIFLETFQHLKQLINDCQSNKMDFTQSNSYLNLENILHLNKYKNELRYLTQNCNVNLKLLNLNHFNKKVIFMDFNELKYTQNLILIFNIINEICKYHQINCAKTPFHAHCTLFKTSKLNNIQKSLLQLERGFKNDFINSLPQLFSLHLNNYHNSLIQNVIEVQLCQINKQIDSYYKIIDSILLKTY